MNSKLLFLIFAILSTLFLVYKNNNKFLAGSKENLLGDQQFEAWRQKHNKIYGSSNELNARKQIFLSNMQKVDQLKSSGIQYQVALNQFSDLSFEEFSGKTYYF